MSNQIVSTLPDGIPAPQFSLFQKVRRKTDKDSSSGIVVGLTYFTFRAALKDGTEMGWEIDVDWVHAASEEQALKLMDSRETFDEDELEAL